MITPSSAEELAGSRLPLCARYASVHANLLGCRGNAGSAEHASLVFWALAVTFDGEREILGAWSQSETSAGSSKRVVADLEARGLQELRVLVNGASEEFASAALRAYPRVAVVESFHQLQSLCLTSVEARERALVSRGLSAVWRVSSSEAAGGVLSRLEQSAWRGLAEVGRLCGGSLVRSQAFFALPRRVRSAVLQADCVAGRLQEGASAVLRRQCFASQEAAAAFAESWLVATERRLSLRRLASALPRRAVTAFDAAGQ